VQDEVEQHHVVPAPAGARRQVVQRTLPGGERHARLVGGLPRGGEHAGRRVEHRDVVPGGGEREAVGPVPSADIEHPQAPHPGGAACQGTRYDVVPQAGPRRRPVGAPPLQVLVEHVGHDKDSAEPATNLHRRCLTVRAALAAV